MKTLSVDVAVIGHGSAGGNATRTALKYTDSVVSIEGNMYGTTCARVGCMPSKLLISAADAAHEARHAKVFGVHADIKIDGKEVMKRVRDMRDFFVSHVVKGVESIPEKNRVRGMARFLDRNTIQVDDHTQIRTKSSVIATGSTPFIPKFLSPVFECVQTSDELFYWEDLPKSVAVFGTGIIALEMGQALSRLGVRVTIFGRSGKIGFLSGPGMQDAMCKTLHEELDLVPRPNIKQIEKINGKAKIEFIDSYDNHRTEEYEVVLSATGRTPNTDKIGIENIDVPLDSKGVPVFDPDTLQCGDAPVFIAGDAMNIFPLLHEASDEGQQAGYNAAHYPKIQPITRRVPVNIIFSSPQIASSGKLYSELDPNKIIVGEVDMTKQGRAQVMAQNKGQIQLYFDKKSEKLLGAEMFSVRAEHFSHLFSWMIAKEATLDEMLEMPFYHPVFEEGLRTALRDAKGKM